jgi:hypothetical protein
MKCEIDLPFPKNHGVEGPQIKIVPGEVELTYDYVPEEARKQMVIMRFTRVIAYRYYDETCCVGSPDMVSDGLIQYDLGDSPWLRNIKENRDRFFAKGSIMYQRYGEFDFHHYALWFDEEGCYEIVARSFDIKIR